MKYSKLIADMIEEGADAAMILVAVRSVERQEEDALDRRRAADRARQERHRLSRDITLGNVSHAPSRSHVRTEDKTSNSDIEPPEKNNTPAPPSPRERLETVLDAQRAGDVIEHRKRIKAPLTSRAAQLLAKDFAKWPDANAAADEMVKRGWRGFDPSWMPGQRAGPPGLKPNPGLSTVDALLEQVDAITPSETQGNPPRLSLVALSGGR